MKVQVKITNGEKEVQAVIDDIQLVQAQGVIDVLHEFLQTCLPYAIVRP